MIQYAAIILFVIGLYGLFISRHVIRMLIALNVMEIGLNLFIVSIGFSSQGFAPILSSTNDAALVFVDPLPQALVLTAIVIGVGTTALGLAFAKRIYQQYQSFDLSEMEENA